MHTIQKVYLPLYTIVSVYLSLFKFYRQKGLYSLFKLTPNHTFLFQVFVGPNMVAGGCNAASNGKAGTNVIYKSIL